MAVHKSAKKRIRSNAKKAAANKTRLSATRTAVRKVEEAVKSGDTKAAAEALRAAEPQLQRTARKGIVHKRNASRKISRLAKRVKEMGSKPAAAAKKK